MLLLSGSKYDKTAYDDGIKLKLLFLLDTRINKHIKKQRIL